MDLSTFAIAALLAAAFFAAQVLEVRNMLGTVTRLSSRLPAGQSSLPAELLLYIGIMLLAIAVAISGQFAPPVLLTALLAAGIALAPVSVIWAGDKMQCLIASTAWLALGVAALALGLTSSFTTSIMILTTGGFCSLLFAVVVELKQGSPLPGYYYRFWGGIGCNENSTNAALSCLGACYLYSIDLLPSVLLVMLWSAALCIMYLTRAIASYWALAAAVMVWYLHSLMDAPHLLTLTFAVAVAVGLAILFIPPVRRRIAASIHLGRSDATLTRLSGRWTIWRLLVPTIRRNLLLGVGYRSYWNQQGRDQLRRDCGFENPVWTAHSIYIETLLNGGIIALALLLFTAGHALWLAFSMHNSQDSFVMALIMFVLVSGVAESGFTLPRFATFAVILVLTAFGGGGYFP